MSDSSFSFAQLVVFKFIFESFYQELAEKENITEELKATDMILWVRKMNNTRNRVTEIVNERIIYNI